MRRNLVLSLVITVAVAALALGLTILSGNKPQLGLDLQGGASVVLQPKESVDSGVLDQTIAIIRNRVDALGVAEPEITRQGNSILVELPGVKDQDRALQLVGQTAELRFRPTLQNLPPDASQPVAGSTTTVAGATSTVAGATTTVAGASVEGAATTAAGATASDAGASSTAASAGTTVTIPTQIVPTTPSDQDDPSKDVVLEQKDRSGTVTARYSLGPVALTGAGVETAEARLDPSSGQWSVHLTMKTGQTGIDGWNQLATRCFNRDATCPTGQIAIVLDSVVQSAPVVQTGTFQRDQIQITGNFTEREAKNLALVLRYGALPVQLEPQAVQTVSASLGQDSLRAGVVSGIIGLLLVVLFMLLYYRRLGLVVPAGLCISGALLWAIVCYLGHSRGLALTLAGITGIIVSIGVTVDSYVVYFERLKDDVRLGRTLRASAERSFSGAYRTILAADSASLIGAVILWYFTVGSVRGFAFFLGLSTLLDMIVSFFFTRPAVILMSRGKAFAGPDVLGVHRGEAMDTGEKPLVGAFAMTDLDTRPAEDQSPEPRPGRGGFFHRLYHGETHFDFVGKRRIGFIISGVVILVSLLSLFTRGLNLGIEFEGGVAWEFTAQNTSVDQTRSTLEKFGINDGKIQTLRGTDGERIRAQAGPQTGATSSGVRQTLAENAKVDVGEVSFTSIGPTWGEEITRKALRALVFFFIALALYITVRFEWRMAVAALAAVVHDVLISVGVYSLFGFEVTPATVIAFLTILGFSLYDTIVVFDKVHENTKRVLATGRATYGDVVNLSMNQVLARSLNTTLCAVLPVLSLLFVGSILMGATALEDFALALLVGLITGSYSSIFIATPILAVLKEREPRYKALKAKFGSTTILSTVPAATAVATLGSAPAPARVGATGAKAPSAMGGAAVPAGSSTGGALGHPPRPRKKKRR